MVKPFDMKGFKEAAHERKQALYEQLRSGAMSARAFTAALSAETDGNIRTLAEHFLPDHKQTVSLVFTGGNGRQEIAPASDLDILMLVPEEMSKDLSPELERDWSSFVTALWDAGYEPGAIVRTPAQCEEESLKDQTVWSSLLDRRLVWGDQGHFDAMSGRIDKLNETHWEKYLDEKLGETAGRHKNTSDSRYFVQPDIKEGKGGLRDFHSMMWISHVVFNARTLDDLAEKGLLSTFEAKRVQEAYDCLLEARCHLQAQGKSNRLTAENQPRIANEIMHFQPQQRQQAIEDYMRLYFLHARDIGFLTNVVCAAALEKKAGYSAPVQNVEGFILRTGKLRFSTDSPSPQEMMRIFRIAHEHKAEVHPDALRTIKRNQGKFDETALKDPEINADFMAVITSGHEVGPSLRRMQECDILSRIVPPMGAVDLKVQFDPYHAYTVDEHIFQAMDRMDELKAGQYEAKAKVAVDIARNLKPSDRRVLAVAMLLHDCGKDEAETGDEDLHPVRGGDMVRQYGPGLGLNPRETKRAAWLVENHLLLVHSALRRQLNDPWTVETFAKKVGSEKNLELLTLMTTADVMGNSPEAWEPNVAVRVANLYHRTKAHMRSEAFEPEEHALMLDDDARNTKVSLKDDFMRNATVIEVVTPQNSHVFQRLTAILSADNVNVVGMDFEANADGTVTHTTIRAQNQSGSVLSEWQKKQIQEKIEKGLQDESAPLTAVTGQSSNSAAKPIPYRLQPEVDLSNELSAQCTVIEVTAPDRPSLLNNVARIFNEQGLEVKHARVSTHGRSFKAQDTFYVVDRETSAQVDPSRFEEIRQALLDSPALSPLE